MLTMWRSSVFGSNDYTLIVMLRNIINNITSVFKNYSKRAFCEFYHSYLQYCVICMIPIL